MGTVARSGGVGGHGLRIVREDAGNTYYDHKSGDSIRIAASTRSLDLRGHAGRSGGRCARMRRAQWLN